MMNTRAIKAFTLVEMIIVLIIASLIVALSFTVLNIVQRNLGDISKQFVDDNSEILFQSRLDASFMKYRESYCDSVEQKVIFRNNIDSVTYKLNQYLLITEQDTFKCKKIYFLFQGDTVSNGAFDAMGCVQEKSDNKIFSYRINDSKAYLNGIEN